MRSLATAFVWSVWLWGQSALASVVVAQSFEDMSRNCPVVVHARIGQVQAAYSTDGKAIETWAEVVALEFVKGDGAPGQTLLVRNPGGTVGKVGTRVSGAPSFQTGEEVVLFLERALDNPQAWLVNGLAAGKVTFQQSEQGNKMAKRDLRGLSFYDRNRAGAKLLEVRRPEELGTAQTFLARIRKAVRR